METIAAPYRVLVVEDCDEDFDTFQRAGALVEFPLQVIRVPTGGDCLDLLSGSAGPRPAMVLMDLSTPGIDGREALATIKSDPELRAIPVLVLSASADPRDLSFCSAAGGDAYHVKPTRYPEHLSLLVQLLDHWLGRSAVVEKGGENR